RAERFHFPRDAGRYAVGRGVLRILLGRYLHRAPEELRFQYGARGKPALADRPRGRALRFNLAHSRDLAIYAVSWDREVGVDVEEVRADRADQEIAARFFSPAEV